MSRAVVAVWVLAVLPLVLSGCGSGGWGGSAPTPPDARALPTRASPSGSTPSTGLAGPLPVTDVVDGDTLRVRAGARLVTVRLLGVDTPELRAPGGPQCYARQAATRAEQLLAGREVLLEYDHRQGRLDRYGRTLAYVRLAEGQRPGTLVNEVLLREGSAREYDRGPPHRYEQEFDAAEADARSSRRGLWAAC